jgi:threonyl-tRNA synthetase
MRTLFLHSDYIEVIPKSKALKICDRKKELKVKDCLVVFVCVEDKDNENTLINAKEEILKHCKNLKVNKVVLYPWAHLSKNLANPKDAKKLFNKLYNLLKSEIETYKAPFGWYKEFTIKVKGHPLSELSREFTSEISVEKEQEFYILYPDGKLEKVEEVDLNKFNKEFRILVEKEGLKKPYPEIFSEENPYLQAFKKFGFEWEPWSDYGHMRLGPLATTIFNEVENYSREVVNEFSKKNKIKIYEIKGTAFFNLKEYPIKKHSELFGERLYSVETDKGRFIIRYAACFQQFAMVKDWIISYKDLPFGTFEIADSYRFEQSGECTLCFRLRRFYMPDLHIYCKSIKESMKIVFKVQEKLVEEYEKKLGLRVELLLNISKREYFEKYKDFFIKVAKHLNRPILLNIITKGPEYYWIANAEFHILDVLGRVREIGTWQIDIGNSKRFGIKYITKGNKHRYPIILHIAFTPIERYIYSLFTSALKMEKPQLPFRFSPIQVAVIPIKKTHKKHAKKLLNLPYRIEIDENYDETLGKRILKYEKLWVPVIIVIGDNEVKNNNYSVRLRTGEQKVLTKKEIRKLLNALSK